MLINWFTVLAQLVNFTILLVALKFLLYDRILDAMERRRKEFADREQETDRLRREAEEERQRVEQDRREIEANWETMIEEARREADDRRRELLEQARSYVEHQEQQWRDSMHAERDRLLVELQRATGEQAMSIARSALQDLAGTEMENGMIRTFADRLRRLGAQDGDEVVDALRVDDGGPIHVRTSFALSDAGRDTIRRAVHGLVDDPHREIEWERDPNLVGGIVVEVGPRSIGWTIDTYLNGLRGTFSDILRHQLRASAEATTDRAQDHLEIGTP